MCIRDSPKGDLTVHDVDKVYYIILWNNPAFDYYGIVDYTNLNGYYIERGSKIRLDYTEMGMYKISLIYDDGG